MGHSFNPATNLATSISVIFVEWKNEGDYDYCRTLHPIPGYYSRGCGRKRPGQDYGRTDYEDN